MKIKYFISQHKIFLFTLGFILVYEFIVVGNCKLNIVDDVVYSYYAVDFSMGFCTKILPGAIYNKLVGIYTYEAVSIYVHCLYFIFICIVSIIIEKFVKSVPQKYSSECLLMVFLFLTGPFFSAFLCEIGMLDFYWALFFAISILLLKNRFLRWLVLPLAFLTGLVHYSSVISYIAGLLLIILFMFAHENNKREKIELMTLFSSTFAVSALETLYFLGYEYDNLTYNLNTFNNILINERNVKTVHYYDFAFYKLVEDSELPAISMDQFDTSSLNGLIKNIFYQIQLTFKVARSEEFWFAYIIGAVLLVFLLYILVSYIRKTDKVSKKIVVSLMIALYFCIVLIGILLSTDITRWLAHSFIIMFTSALFIIKFDYIEFFEKFKVIFEKIYWPCIGYCLIYAFTIVPIYC